VAQQSWGQFVARGRATRASVLPTRIEHEVLDDELTTTVEQVEQANGSVRPLESVVLVDSHHRKHSSLGAESIAGFRHRLLVGKQGNAGLAPFFAAGDLGQRHWTDPSRRRSVAVLE
jgi:hypothetical protein